MKALILLPLLMVGSLWAQEDDILRTSDRLLTEERRQSDVR